MAESINRKYVLWLTGIAVAILGVGLLLRPKKPAPKPPSSSETANLQRLVRRDELRNMGKYFAERASAVAEHLRYLPETQASGVYWEKAGQVVSSSRQLPVRAVQTESMAVPPLASQAESTGGRWVLLAWMEPGQKEPEWITAIDGGRRESVCDGEKYRELIVNSALTTEMLGAAVFDLDGVLVGLVAQCGASLHVISSQSLRELLGKFSDAEHRLHALQGVAVRKQEDGLFVTETTTRGAGFAAGLRPGDSIAELPDAAALLAWLEGPRETPLRVVRGRRKMNLAKAATEGLELLPDSPPALYVAAGSAAEQAGLRTGDRLVQPTVAELRRLLAPGAKRPQPTLLVYERDDVRFARLVEMAP